jgi:hypothetical protein
MGTRKQKHAGTKYPAYNPTEKADNRRPDQAKKSLLGGNFVEEIQ